MLLIAADVLGLRLRDRDGTVVGRVTAFYSYPTDMHAAAGAVAVTWGRVVRSTRLVDLLDAVLDGPDVVAAYPLAVIRSAPEGHAPSGRTLGDDHAMDVLLHYRLNLAPA